MIITYIFCQYQAEQPMVNLTCVFQTPTQNDTFGWCVCNTTLHINTRETFFKRTTQRTTQPRPSSNTRLSHNCTQMNPRIKEHVCSLCPSEVMHLRARHIRHIFPAESQPQVIHQEESSCLPALFYRLRNIFVLTCVRSMPWLIEAMPGLLLQLVRRWNGRGLFCFSFILPFLP